MQYKKKVKEDLTRFPYQLTEWQRDWIDLCWVIVQLDPYEDRYNKDYIVRSNKEGHWAVFTEGKYITHGYLPKPENIPPASPVKDEEFYWHEEEKDKLSERGILAKLKTM